MNILLVDNNKTDLIVNRDLLQVYGHTVDDVTSSDAAILKADVNKYDIALVEINLPNDSGMKLLETLATIHSEIPVFVLTEGISVARAIKVIKLKAVDIVLKPLNSKKIGNLQKFITNVDVNEPHKDKTVTAKKTDFSFMTKNL